MPPRDCEDTKLIKGIPKKIKMVISYQEELQRQRTEDLHWLGGYEGNDIDL